MSFWYFVLNGQPHGPISKEELINKINNGDLRENDWILKKGDKNWTKLKNYQEIIDETQKRFVEKKEWVVLHYLGKKEEKDQFIQKGPFATEEIIHQIRSGITSYSDFIWKKGMKEWSRIGSLEGFDRREINSISLPQPPGKKEDSKNTTSDKVDLLLQERVDWKSILQEEPLPDEITQLPQVELIKEENFEKVEILEKKDISDTTKKIDHNFLNISFNKKESRPWWYGGLVGLVLVVFIGTPFLVYYIYKEVMKKELLKEFNVKENQPISVSLPPPIKKMDQKIDVKKAVESEPIKPQQVKKTFKAPSYAKFEFIPPDSIVLKTDASQGHVILLSFIGRTGRVLDHPSYIREIKSESSGFEETRIFLKNFHIPDGDYNFEGTLASFRFDKKIFIGEKNLEFKKKLAHHRKKISFQQQSEKAELFDLLDKLETKVLQFKQGLRESGKQNTEWKSFYKNWQESIVKINHSNLSTIKPSQYLKFTFPLEWDKARQLRREIIEWASDANKNVIKNLDPPTASIYQKTKELKDHVVLLSGWK